MPFAALPKPEKRRIRNPQSAIRNPLVGNHEIISLPSASVLAELRREQAGRELILDYYGDTGVAKIEHRRALSACLGVSLDSLRHRVARMKIKLSLRVKHCMRLRPPRGICEKKRHIFSLQTY